MTDEMKEPGSPTWAGGRMARHPSGRHRQVGVRLSDAELDELRYRAEDAGVSPQRYLMEAALGGGTATAAARRRRVDEFGFLTRQLVRLGTNVNQLAKVANSTGQVPTGTSRALAAIERLVAQLAAATDRLTGAFGRPAP
ncbi:MAG: MobC family plasmid mobilization relaxosome protein [Acidimicrobiales bacterium]